MPKTLSEFLRERAKDYAAEAAKNKQVVSEWQAAVAALVDRLLGWLRDSDSERVIQTNLAAATIREPGLGWYEAARLDFNVFGDWLRVVPVARLTGRTLRTVDPAAKAAGRVDLTDDFRRYYLYRFPGAGDEEWFIEGPPDDELRPLTRDRFEQAVLSYL